MFEELGQTFLEWLLVLHSLRLVTTHAYFTIEISGQDNLTHV